MVVMKNISNELSQIVSDFSTKIAHIPDEQFSAKPKPEKWSKKEVLGHLIDSANNNLRRFICGQYEPSPKIIYQQDFWVAANNYQHVQKENVIQLWKLLNVQICEVLQSMPSENANRPCDTGRDNIQPRSIQWLAEDYVKHLKHHLNQIIPNSFNITYP
jgi:hemerythrin-like domain-containing protein